MKINEIEIDEVSVVSSWITDLEWAGDDGVLLMLNSGREYLVRNMPAPVYKDWISAPSKGRFWHSDVKGLYIVTRVR